MPFAPLPYAVAVIFKSRAIPQVSLHKLNMGGARYPVSRAHISTSSSGKSSTLLGLRLDASPPFWSNTPYERLLTKIWVLCLLVLLRQGVKIYDISLGIVRINDNFYRLAFERLLCNIIGPCLAMKRIHLLRLVILPLSSNIIIRLTYFVL